MRGGPFHARLQGGKPNKYQYALGGRMVKSQMNRARFSAVLISLLFLVSTFSMTLVPVLAKARSAKGQDVHWVKNVDPGRGTWKAIIFKTGNGIVREWRYEWNGESIDVHVMYWPLAKFTNEPKGKNWVRWTFDGRYEDLGGDEADLTDFFTWLGEYWVHSNHRLY